MLRSLLVAVAAVALCALSGQAADTKAKKARNQMVKGTIKSVDIKTGVLVVAQQVKGEKVDRQLDIKPETEFEVTIDGKTTTASGKDGLALLEEKIGASVNVKCDKDVNVLKVTAKVGKKK